MAESTNGVEANKLLPYCGGISDSDNLLCCHDKPFRGQGLKRPGLYSGSGSPDEKLWTKYHFPVQA